MTDLLIDRQPCLSQDDDSEYDDEYYRKLEEERLAKWYFTCVGKGLTTLEGLVMPETIRTVDISCNKLTSLRGLPIHVKRVLAEYNQISTLEGAHEGLEYISLTSNLLSNLVGCPKSMIELDCDRNQLTSLIGANEGLLKLHCQCNSLDSFDYLPNSLKTVSLHSNPMTTLKVIPPNIQFLWTFPRNSTFCRVELDVDEVPYSMEWVNQQPLTVFKISLYNSWTGLSRNAMPSKEDWEASKKPLTSGQLMELNQLSKMPMLK